MKKLVCFYASQCILILITITNKWLYNPVLCRCCLDNAISLFWVGEAKVAIFRPTAADFW